MSGSRSLPWRGSDTAAGRLRLRAIAVSPDLRRYRNVLLVFAHADDEAVTCAGTIYRLASLGAATTLALLTGGERGNPMGLLDPTLKELRASEAVAVSQRLRVTRLLQQDFGDGQLNERRREVLEWLAATIGAEQYDLLITFDPAGLDGHPDHITCSNAVTEVHRARSSSATLWYVALPAWLLSVLRAARQMRYDPKLDALRARPTHRVFIGQAIPAKMRALAGYRSQRKAIGKGLGRMIPPWIGVGLQPFEYFSQAR